MSDYITYEEAGDILGVTKTTIHRWVKSGKLAARTTKKGYHRVLRSSVDDLAKERGENT